MNRSRRRTHTTTIGALLLIAGATACGDETRASDRAIDEHMEVLILTPDDYLTMTNEEFVAAARRRLGAVQGLVGVLRERGAASDSDEQLSTALEARLVDFERAGDDAPLETRAAIATELADLERRVRLALDR